MSKSLEVKPDNCDVSEAHCLTAPVWQVPAFGATDRFNEQDLFPERWHAQVTNSFAFYVSDIGEQFSHCVLNRAE